MAPYSTPSSWDSRGNWPDLRRDCDHMVCTLIPPSYHVEIDLTYEGIATIRSSCSLSPFPPKWKLTWLTKGLRLFLFIDFLCLFFTWKLTWLTKGLRLNNTGSAFVSVHICGNWPDLRRDCDIPIPEQFDYLPVCGNWPDLRRDCDLVLILPNLLTFPLWKLTWLTKGLRLNNTGSAFVSVHICGNWPDLRRDCDHPFFLTHTSRARWKLTWLTKGLRRNFLPVHLSKYMTWKLTWLTKGLRLVKPQSFCEDFSNLWKLTWLTKGLRPGHSQSPIILSFFMWKLTWLTKGLRPYKRVCRISSIFIGGNWPDLRRDCDRFNFYVYEYRYLIFCSNLVNLQLSMVPVWAAASKPEPGGQVTAGPETLLSCPY